MPQKVVNKKELKKRIPRKRESDSMEEEKNKTMLERKTKKGRKAKDENYPIYVVEPNFEEITIGRIYLNSAIPSFSVEAYPIVNIEPSFEKIKVGNISIDSQLPSFKDYVENFPIVLILPQFENLKTENIQLVRELPEFTTAGLYPVVYVSPSFDKPMKKIIENTEIILDDELPKELKNINVLKKIVLKNRKIEGVNVVKEGYNIELKTFEDFIDEPLRKIWESGSLIYGERPTVIWIGDNKLTPLFKIITRELYRIKMGGLPKSYHYDVLAEPFHGAVEDVTADKSVFVIGENAIKRIFDEKILKDENIRDLFLSKLESIYSHRGGFVIIESLPLIQIQNEIRKIEIKNPSFKEIIITEGTILNIETLNKVFLNLFGFEFSSKDLEKEAFYGQVDKKYQDALEKLAADPEYTIWVRPSHGEESLLHYALKVFTFRYLIKNKGIDKEKILVEVPPCGEEYIPDILVSEGATVYEIETFYGRGFSIARNLKEKVENAEKCIIKGKRIDFIHFVISPLHYFVIGKYILKILRKIKKSHRQMKIYLDIPNFGTGEFNIIEIKPDKNKKEKQ